MDQLNKINYTILYYTQGDGEIVPHVEDGRYAYRVFVGRTEGRRLLERPRHRWEENIKINLMALKVGWDGTWTGLIFLRIGAGGGIL
jgi:hypothetical protein